MKHRSARPIREAERSIGEIENEGLNALQISEHPDVNASGEESGASTAMVTALTSTTKAVSGKDWSARLPNAPQHLGTDSLTSTTMAVSGKGLLHRVQILARF